MRALGLLQVACLVAGAVLNCAPYLNTDGRTLVPSASMWAHVGKALIGVALVILLLRCRSLRGAIWGDDPACSWRRRAARWNWLMSVGSLIGGGIALAITHWRDDLQGSRIAVTVMIVGFLLFGSMGLLWRQADRPTGEWWRRRKTGEAR